MTLILGMSKAEGVYLGVDLRVTDSRTGKVIDDEAPKSLHIIYPPDKGGPKALLAYTGVAELRGGLKTGDWLRETLRGENRTINDSMQHLRNRLNRDMAKYRRPLIVNALVVEGDKRFFGALSNISHTAESGDIEVRREFTYTMKELAEPFAFSNGLGAMSVGKSSELIQQQLAVTPRDVEDHMNLLASINRKVAELDQSVSPHCYVTFLDGSGDQPAKSVLFRDPGETVELIRGSIVFGIDTTDMMQSLMDSVAARRRGESEVAIDMDGLNETLEGCPRAAPNTG